jgi:TolB-like protein/DNA-binding winged helix-turn-helix (wHTH) protein/Tfp pilus assembly protein PilF
MSSPISRFYRFGEFRVDTQSRSLQRGTELVPLSPKGFEVLLVLVQKNGSIVSKEELMMAVWPDSFVEESNLTQTVFVLRKTLRETPGQRYILTVQGRGYRFAPSVVPEDEDAILGTGSAVRGPLPVESPIDAAESDARRPKSWLLVAGALSALCIAGAVGYFWLTRPRIQMSTQPASTMLAVLPFGNLTGDAGQEYFSDGLTEELITQLGNLDRQHLRVIARASVMHYKTSQPTISQIGRELDAQYVVEGSVRRDADHVRVTAELISVKDQKRLWAREYNRELLNVLNVQDEIAEAVGQEIRLTLGDHFGTKETVARPPLSPAGYQAYDLYLRGRYFWNKRSPHGFEQAVKYFQEAIAKAPDYAPPYAGLADSYALMSAYGIAPPSVLIPKARAAAQQALKLDENLAEAHVSLAVIAQDYDWDWKTSEEQYQRAIQLDPNYATAHHWYAEHLALRGRFDEAFAEMNRALQLDPLSLIVRTDDGVILYFARQYDRALEQFRVVHEMEPGFPRNMTLYAYVQENQFDRAFTELDRLERIDDKGSWIWGAKAYTYGRSGKRSEARRALEKMNSLNHDDQLDPLIFVAPNIAIGATNEAFALLDRSVAIHSPGLTAVKVDPIYDPLRSDPRFERLLLRLGLTE